MDAGVGSSGGSTSKIIKSKGEINDHTDGISAISVSTVNMNNGSAACFDGTVSIYDGKTLTQKKLLKRHTGGVWSICYNPKDDNAIVSGGNDNKVIHWDARQDQPVNVLSQHKNTVYDVRYSNNGKLMASCSKDLICVWDAYKDIPIALIPEKGENGFVYCVNFVENDTAIITGFINGTVIKHIIGKPPSENDVYSIIGDYHKDVSRDEFEPYSKSVFSLKTFHSDDNKIALTHSDGSVKVFSGNESDKKLKLLDDYFYFTAPCTSVSISKDDKLIAACAKDRTGMIWKSGVHDKVEYTLSGHRGIMSGIEFVGSDRVVTSSYDNTIKIWEI